MGITHPGQPNSHGSVMPIQSEARSDNLSVFAQRLLQLRKTKKWTQPELAKKVGTSGPIIGRYERGEMVPSIDVARRIANAFDVTLDYLFNDGAQPSIVTDKATLKKWLELENLPQEDRERIQFVMDCLIRDAKARQAYGA